MRMIKIQSSKTIRVTKGLDYQDFTKKDSDLKDRMKIAPVWQNTTILLEAGVSKFYPSYVKEWPTIKALEKEGVITLGEIKEDKEDEEEFKKLNEELKKLEKTTKTTKKVIKSTSLEEAIDGE